MSFTFGNFNSDSLGLIATLRAYPSLGGLGLETLEAPGTDGLILAGATRSSTQFEFDVIIRGSSPEEVAAHRDDLVLALDPARGERQLGIDAAPGWCWAAIASVGIDWERLTWDDGLGFQLRGDVVFDALSAYGRLVEDESWSYASAGTRTVTRREGNARSFPTVEVRGTIAAGEHVTVEVGDVAVQVSGPLSSGQVLRLDWDAFDFGRWSGSRKVASSVRSMSTLDRPVLWPNEATRFRVAATGTVTAAALFANSRRQ